MQLLGISGSLRAASSSTALLLTLKVRLGPDITLTQAVIGDIPLYNADHDGGAAVARLRAEIEIASGLIFVTPEYNYSIPGVLKNAIDWVSRPAYASPFKGKRCMVISVSNGALGGVRAQAHLKYILNGMLAEVPPTMEVVVPRSQGYVREQHFDDESILKFATQAIQDSFKVHGR